MNEKKQNILKAQSIKKTFIQAEKNVVVLNGVSQTFEQGHSYAITGASGSGKSTFMHILGGLDEPSSGQVLFNNEPLFSLRKKNEVLNRSIGFVFQFHYLINELTVFENISLMGRIKGESSDFCSGRAHELLKATGMEQKADSFPAQLSGGEQQRVSIIRALFNKPSFLIADEPTGNLDAHNAQQLVELFMQSQKEWGMGIIICSHDAQVYNKMQTIFTLKDGLLQKEIR